MTTTGHLCKPHSENKYIIRNSILKFDNNEFWTMMTDNDKVDIIYCPYCNEKLEL